MFLEASKLDTNNIITVTRHLWLYIYIYFLSIIIIII
jgi:hypothetical protein